MTEPKFMQLCRDNPGQWFDCVHVGGYPNRACLLKGTNDVWVVETETYDAYVRTYTDVVDHYTDPKPKPERRFDVMAPASGYLACKPPTTTLQQALRSAEGNCLYSQPVEVIVYAVNEDGSRGKLLYGMPEVD